MTHDAQVALLARADLYRFLSACYYQPTRDFDDAQIFDSMAAAAAAIHPDLEALARKLGLAFAEQSVEELLVDYTRLFLGPVRALAMPYGCMWQQGDATLMQASTIAVREQYENGGFEIGEDFADLPDHIAVELEFLYLLLFRQCEATQQAQADEVASTRQMYATFLREQLGAWVGGFAAAVKAHAETGFYRELATLTANYVSSEVDRLALPAGHDTREQ